MASSIFLLPSILLLILFHVLSVTEPTCSASILTQNMQTGFRATLARVKLPKNRHFLNELSPSAGSGISSTLTAYYDEYVMDLKIGTPPMVFKVVMDTGSNLIWTKCKPNSRSSLASLSPPAAKALMSYKALARTSITYSSINKYKYSSSSSPQNPSSLFDPLISSTFSESTETCKTLNLLNCELKYADNSAITIDFVGLETLTMGSTSVKIPSVTFAGGTPDLNQGFKYDGVMGMGRGKLSLLSQLNEQVFSYCMASRVGDDQNGGILLIGSEARNAIANTNIQTMPLLGKEGPDSLYYLSLEGISVGETRLKVTKSDFTTEDGKSKMLIDSGSTFTSLEKGIVDMINHEFLIQTKLEKSEINKQPYDDIDFLCFMSPSDGYNIIPKIVFHFEGADWELPSENYIYEQDSHACLGIIANGPNDPSVLGNMQQQNMMVIYDLDRSSLSFMPANCDKL